MDLRSGALEELLSYFAAGRLQPALHALVETHLQLSPASRRFLQAFEDAASLQLDADEPVGLANRDASLAAIFASPAPVFAASPSLGGDVCPAPLRVLMGDHGNRDLHALPWRRFLPAIKRVPIDAGPGVGEVNFYWIKAGKRLPWHTHAGQEITLVLRGGFSDITGHYVHGDIAIADADIEHRPIADSDEDCICFAVTDAPLLLTGPVGRIVQRLLGGRH